MTQMSENAQYTLVTYYTLAFLWAVFPIKKSTQEKSHAHTATKFLKKSWLLFDVTRRVVYENSEDLKSSLTFSRIWNMWIVTFQTSSVILSCDRSTGNVIAVWLEL